MGKHSIAQFIKEYYPEYYSWNEYPADKCIPFITTQEKWGILGNFARIPLVVDGICFVNSEQLFQMMKFRDSGTLHDIYSARGMNIKYSAKRGEKEGLRRQDWGQIIVDCMKFCLQTKYEQSEEFRNTLNQTSDHIIVEDQTRRKNIKAVDTWGTVMVDDKYVGSNLTGRLLMELRDNGKLEYHLPEDIFEFISILGNSRQLYV